MVPRLSAPAIRKARLEDSADLSRLIAQLGYDAAPAEVAERLAAMEAEGRAVFVAEADRRGPMQHAHDRGAEAADDAPVGRISMMVVEEGVRGQGIGAALVASAERHLLKQGCRIVEVTSNLARTRAHRFYESLGYEKSSVRLAREL